MSFDTIEIKIAAVSVEQSMQLANDNATIIIVALATIKS